MLRNIDFSSVESEEQRRIKQVFIDITSSKENERHLNQYYSSAVIRFCKTTELSFEDLEEIIVQNCPSFYSNAFALEMSAQCNKDLSEYIKANLEDARLRNTTQGKNGAYSGYSYENFDVIYNIISYGEITCDAHMLLYIVDVVIDTLASERQTVEAKLSAIKLLQLLYSQYNQDNIWTSVSQKMIDNMVTFSSGYEMSFFSTQSNFVLSFQYDLFLSNFDESRRESLLEKLFSLDWEDPYNIIQFLKIIATYLENTKDQLQSADLISAFLHYSITMSQHKERDVKFHAVKCLIELTNFNITKKLALIHLAHIMNTGSQTEKIAIITRISKIRADDDSYLNQIINRGKADSNYFVRYVADRESPSSK